MPAETLMEGAAAVLRWCVQQVVWFVVEIVLTGSGYLVLRLLRSRRCDDPQACLLVGVALWVAMGFGLGWWLRRSTG